MPGSARTAPAQVRPGLIGCCYIALAPVLTIFLLIPLELYTNAAQYWRWNTGFPNTFMQAGLVFYAGLGLLLTLLNMISARVMKASALGLFYLGLFALLADVLSPLQTGLLDGSVLESDEPIFYTLIEIVLLVFVVFLARRLGTHAAKVTVLMTSFLLVLSIAYAIYAATLKPPETYGLPVREVSQEHKGNVYHIVLDEMQTDAAQGYINSHDLQSTFSGFTFYRNSIANYIYTNVSMPSYLTGKLYHSGSFTQWQESYKDTGIFRRMYDAGFEVQLYTVYDHWCSPYAQECHSLDEVFEQKTGLLGSDFVTFIQIWFARVAPNFISNWALLTGNALGNFVDSKFNATAENIPKTIATGKAPYASILMLDEVIQSEQTEPGGGRYLYAHAIIPHGPYVMNTQCEYDANLWRSLGSKRAYYQQVGCSINKVAELLAELKRLGRYQDATIVIHADTGHGHNGFLDFDRVGDIVERGKTDSPLVKLDDKFLKTEEWYLSRSMALFMIKPPGAGGALQISTEAVQLIDIYPTILAMADVSSVESETLDGQALYGSERSPALDANMYFTSPARPGEIKTLTISDQGDIRNSRLVVGGDQPEQQADSLGITLGFDDDGLDFNGFSYAETSPDGSRHWRWATASLSSIDLSTRLRLASGEYSLELDIEPFAENLGANLTVSIAGQSQEINLIPGWHRYALNYNFQQAEDAVISFNFKHAVSPQSLGISEDPRELAARIGRLVIRPAQ